MIKLRLIVPVLCATAALSGAVAYAQAPAMAGNDAAAPAGWHGHGHGHEFMHVLKQLNLTAEQRTQIKSIFESAKPQLKATHDSMRANHDALLAAAPTDANYPALLATEKNNAAARVQAMSDLKSQIYAVLTPEQQAKIPGILAQDRAAHDAQKAAWMADHP